jgi:hypothetical protein
MKAFFEIVVWLVIALFALAVVVALCAGIVRMCEAPHAARSEVSGVSVPGSVSAQPQTPNPKPCALRAPHFPPRLPAPTPPATQREPAPASPSGQALLGQSATLSRQRFFPFPWFLVFPRAATRPLVPAASRDRVFLYLPR